MAAYTPKHIQPGKKWRSVVQSLLGRIIQRLTVRRAPRPVHPRAVVVGAQRGARDRKYSKQLILPACMLCGIAGLAFGIFQLLAASDIFRLNAMRVNGNHLISQQQVLELAGIEQGISLLHFDSDTAEQKIIHHPIVEHARVKKVWPSGIMVTVRERQPLALVNMEDEKGRRLFYIDIFGKVYSPVESGQDMDFPVITGQSGGIDIQQQLFVEGSLAASAFNLLKLAAQGNAILPVQAISEVHVDLEEGLIVYLVDQPFPIYFGKDRIRSKYYRLVKILERLYRKKQVEEIKEIRMDYTEKKVLVAKVEADG